MVDFIHSKSKFRTILHIQKYKLFSVLYISMCKSAAKLQKKFWNMQEKFEISYEFSQKSPIFRRNVLLLCFGFGGFSPLSRFFRLGMRVDAIN